ncbi:hypothetical protein A3844_08500 [Paenibacillus helianthi]|uniref:WYL domain-containing protein n=1 Tax=Paenibacillus helianthi TaxID=1349432 RepID=A0ABX3EQH6_9BACL|nr:MULTISPECIES: WYL domain-containing protein [Paenibacillus]OKP74619.1 hypothetical protein A3842_20410 [Paenibacillus sp. P3E]OKP88125.1 hypothetical protein A3844_08500 [Paenibacillus helianthi]
MNPFEKIFNYRILSRMEDSGVFLSTSHERSWLKLMLDHPSAAAAFSGVTLDKLQTLLEGEAPLNLAEDLIHKASTAEVQVYHPLVRVLRRSIQHHQGIQVSIGPNNGHPGPEQSGLPYRLEYSMVKREWYLLWYSWTRRDFMSIRLKKITSVCEVPAAPELVRTTQAEIHRILESRRQSAVIEVLPNYNRELSRILYAFSCFEKEVRYDEDKDTYYISLFYLGNEGEYVLSKMRFLGKRVRIVEGNWLKKRMRESALKALALYGASPDQTLTRQE